MISQAKPSHNSTPESFNRATTTILVEEADGDVLIMGKVARNEDSEEMLQLVFDTSAYDLGTGIWSADTKNKYVSTIFEVSKNDIASRTEMIPSGINKQLEKFMTALDDLN